MSLAQSVVCPIQIGRDAQLATLTDLILHSAQGQRHIALISGEAGIGKSRLVAEAKEFAIQQGFSALQGHCFEQDRTFPYAPLVDLLRAFSAARLSETMATHSGDTASALVKLMPELTRDSATLFSSPSLEPEQEKRRLFASLADFFSQLATVQPLLIVVEDLHWSDDSSLEFLLFLARRLSTQPVLLLLTYRTQEANSSFNHLLAQFDRERLATEVTLSHLGRADIDAMVQTIFGSAGATTHEFLDSLYHLTDGNPFFVEEVLKALVTSGEIYYEDGQWTRKPMHELHVPRSVQDAVARRTAHLGAAARQTLTLAAVAGRRFDFSLLQTLTGYDEEDLIYAIKELMAAQLVVEQSEERFAFRHALTRQAIYFDLLARERRSLHRKIAETIERVYADSIDAYCGDLSYHFFAASVWASALDYAKRAAEQAERLYAGEEALRHYERARACAEQLNQPEQMATIDEEMGDICYVRGQLPQTIQAFQRALTLAPSTAARARLKAKLGATYTWNVDERGPEFLREALNELDPETQTNELATTLVWLGRIHWHFMQYTKSIEFVEQALPLAEKVDDAQTLIWVYRQLASPYSMLLRFDESMHWARQCIALGERKAYPVAVTLGYGIMAQNSTWLGKWRQVFDHADHMQQMAEKIGRDGEVLWSNHWRYMALYGLGDLQSALKLARTTMAKAQESGESRLTIAVLTMLTLIEIDIGDEEAAHAHATLTLSRANTLPDVLLRSTARRHLARLHMQREEWEQARELLDQSVALLAGAESVLEMLLMGVDVALTYLALGQVDEAMKVNTEHLAIACTANAQHFVGMAKCVQGQIDTAQSRWDDAAHAFEEAITTLTRTESRLELPHAFYQRGNFYHAQRQATEARADWLQALMLFAQSNARPMLWRTHAALGRLAQAQNQAEEAANEFDAARTIIAELASHLQDATQREKLNARTAKMIPAQQSITPRRAVQRQFDGLTTREREVATLIALGKSSREIAETLVLSERTIEGHVSNILSKLGFTTRTQIAVWAVAKGLVDHPSKNT